MGRRDIPLLLALTLTLLAAAPRGRVLAASHPDVRKDFHTSDRCVACHNGLYSQSGQDVSIGSDWSASIMANSARDPYWQASIRRESMDHPDASAALQDECATCHMAMQHLIDSSEGRKTQVFARFPAVRANKGFHPAADGVSCSVCHQIASEGLGSPKSFSGHVVVASPGDRNNRPEFGPFSINPGHQLIMRSSTGGFVPTPAAHIRDSALCGSCHTLYTVARGPGGRPIGKLPEQMPYLEWLHSDYRYTKTCQDCHMPAVEGPAPDTAIYGALRTGLRKHVFFGGNFFIERMLNDHRKELGVQAQPDVLNAAANGTAQFIRTQAARVAIQDFHRTASGVDFLVQVENLTGHKLPTAYPARRAWLHVVVRDRDGRVVFESGALRPDGFIVGNVNDADKRAFEPHHPVISRPDQVEIFESILSDAKGHVTTGLLDGVAYLKDNRILPHGFDKRTAVQDIAVVGAAAGDPNFVGGYCRTRYQVPTAGPGPYRVTAELWYQPIGYRWAHNLAPYQSFEDQRFIHYYEAAADQSGMVLASDSGTF